jgi:hypothetical protein
MTAPTHESLASLLQSTHDGIDSLGRGSEREIASLSRGFEELARQTRKILEIASAIAACIEDDSITAVLPQVQILGAAARRFVETRLHATQGILETVALEARVLRKLSVVTRSQAAITLRTRVLTMLTNVEVGRLGAAGAGFQNLANELATFSTSLTVDTEELVLHTDARKPAIEATRRVLEAELPRQVAEFARIDASLGDDLKALESELNQLSAMPTQFRAGIGEIEALIGGVVSAVQFHDITRQQIEHVQEAFALIESRLNRGLKRAKPQDRSQAYAGLAIQIYQLQNIKNTVADWTLQIKRCVETILNVSCSELASIAPVVLKQEREISLKLAHIETLEQESQGYSERIRRTVGGHGSLLQFVDQHVKKSRTTRQLLHMLSLNSIVEASHLGGRANAILQIGNGITSLSADWGQVTDQSETAMQEIHLLVQRTSELMQAFSEAGDEQLREAQVQMRTCIDSLRAAAEFASGQTREIELAAKTMRDLSVGISKCGELLDASYSCIDAILHNMDALKLQLEIDHPGIKNGYDASEMEQLFAASYTTELERSILQSALQGKELPPPHQQASSGNDVELF